MAEKKSSNAPLSGMSTPGYARVKAVAEEVLEEGMNEHPPAGYQEFTPIRRSERNGRYVRNLVNPASKLESLTVPRNRGGEFVTEVFECYERLTGNVEKAKLEMYLSGVSTRRIAGTIDATGKIASTSVSCLTSTPGERSVSRRLPS